MKRERSAAGGGGGAARFSFLVASSSAPSALAYNLPSTPTQHLTPPTATCAPTPSRARSTRGTLRSRGAAASAALPLRTSTSAWRPGPRGIEERRGSARARERPERINPICTISCYCHVVFLVGSRAPVRLSLSLSLSLEAQRRRRAAAVRPLPSPLSHHHHHQGLSASIQF